MKKGIIKIDKNNKKAWINRKGTDNYKWESGSWRNYWEMYSDSEWPSKCCKEGCDQVASDGAHIMKSGYGNSNELYIVPFCKSCNHKTDKTNDNKFNLKEDTILVSANTQEIKKNKMAEEFSKEIFGDV